MADNSREGFFLNSHLVGSVAAGILADLSPAFPQGIVLRRQGAGWHLDGFVDQALAHLAMALQQAGHCSHWRNELLSVFSQDGQLLGAIERGATRVLGIHTQAVHLVGFSDQDTWLQQRAMTKADDPGKWDTLSGGMISHQESIAQTLERETWEEAGLVLLDLSQLCYQGTHVVNEPTDSGVGWRHETLHWYTANLSSHQKPCIVDGEVMGFRCVDLDALRSLMAEGLLSADAKQIFETAFKRGLI